VMQEGGKHLLGFGREFRNVSQSLAKPFILDGLAISSPTQYSLTLHARKHRVAPSLRFTGWPSKALYLPFRPTRPRFHVLLCAGAALAFSKENLYVSAK
jgi:hypothetical protein